MRRLSWIVMATIAIVGCNTHSDTNEQLAMAAATETVVEVPSETLYGFDLSEYEVYGGEIEANEVLSTILQDCGINWQTIDALVKNTAETFDFRTIRTGHSYTLLDSDPTTVTPDYLVYEKDAINYVVVSLGDSLFAQECQRKVTLVEREAAGTITSSLYASLQEAGTPAVLAVDMAMLYAWTIDFYRIQKGDEFRVIYQEQQVDGKTIGVEKIIGAEFKHQGEGYFAFAFDDEYGGQYFDEQGHSLKKAFLKSPIKFSRISSRFNKRRFHPVLKRVKAHLGTDYAAPHGTPILATADGVITKSSYSRGNGKYVKVRHNSTYETQYLHMSKRAAKVGDRVRQGDVIGYVGSTGLATGPHVCYRFWKNGEQVDPFREKFPPATPVKVEHKEKFETLIKELRARLDKLETAPKEDEISHMPLQAMVTPL